MNYRHIYHAGGFADVFKHALLALMLRRLLVKPAPLCVLDTHAGIGRYDLDQPAALKTGDFQRGIVRLLADPAPPAGLQPYLDAVRACNPQGGLRWYPGSPLIAATLTRPDDRLVLVELHPDDARSLKREFAGQSRVAVHHADGYNAVKAFLPPPERRGLVLIDPPFEVTDEFARLTAALRTAYRRWPGGTYALWYPIKDRPPVAAFQQQVKETGIRRIMLAELLVQRDDRGDRLNGSGLLLVNPPWHLEQDLAPLLPILAQRLALGSGAHGTWRWLVPE